MSDDDRCPDTIPAPFMGPIQLDEYRCDVCQGVYKRAVGEDELREEHLETFGRPADDDCALVCDDCYQDFMRCYDAGAIATGPGGDA